MINEMLIFLILTCLALIIMAFKGARIRVTPLTVSSAALIGIVLQGVTIIGWKFSAPMTDQMTLHRKVTPLLANQESKQLITKIHVEHDRPVAKGAPLFEVESAPNQYKVDRLTAQVAVAQQEVLQAEAAVEVAKARVEQARAQQEWKKAQRDTAVRVQELNPAAVSKLKVTVAKASYESSQAAVEQALSAQQESEFALTTAKNSLQAVQAQLETAELNLSQNVTRAPSDGVVINWQAVEGTMTTSLIARAQGTFMDLSYTVVAAVFPQNMVNNVEVGNPVEIAFASLPGEIVTGEVDAILEFTGEGQIEPSKEIPVAAEVQSAGYLLVRITLDDEALARELPLGAAGTVAVYSSTGKPFHVLSKVAVRAKMWMNYLPIRL